jgi:prepilin-type N-terminal cleavage/methylation domain-containing protein
MRRSRGFSLIETTVAIALLAVIVVSVLGAFSAITISATRHQQATSLDRLVRSDAEYIKSQAYSATPKATPYLNLGASGYTFSYQALYYDPASKTFTAANADNGLQQLVLTVTGPNAITETLRFVKVNP